MCIRLGVPTGLPHHRRSLPHSERERARRRSSPARPLLAHVAGIPVEEALLAAPALLAGVTVIVGYVRATAARPRR
jgi:hypothetical protein